MSIVKLTKANSKEFLEANKEAFVVVFVDGEFTGEGELVQDCIKALNESDISDKIILATLDAEEDNDLLTTLNIVSVPIVACLSKGVVTKALNLEPTKLITAIKEELNKLSLSVGGWQPVGDQQDQKLRFTNYLQNLINRAPVMIFMKGDPKAPRCGFSRQMVDLLGKHDIKYETFDILEDEDVRQGLKEYSDWPTYPQIYVKGEFVGGLDILKQMEQSGELESTLKI